MEDRCLTAATFRSVERVPPMPRERDIAGQCPAVDMVIGALDGTDLEFASESEFRRAISDGFFLLPTPASLDFSGGDDFVRSFYRPDAGYMGLALPGDYQGYSDRPHDQWENFYIERGNWGLIPGPVAAMGSAMADLGVAVLRGILARLGIDPGIWAQVTGGLTAGGGHRMLAFNHFRADKAMRGCKMHRDSGWVTVLRSTEPGLLALVDGQLRAINPREGHVIINFGSSLEVCTAALPLPVRANIHGVVQTERNPGQDRHSYTMFLDSALDGTIYQVREGAPVALQSVAEFAVQEVARTYDEANDAI